MDATTILRIATQKAQAGGLPSVAASRSNQPPGGDEAEPWAEEQGVVGEHVEEPRLRHPLNGVYLLLMLDTCGTNTFVPRFSTECLDNVTFAAKRWPNGQNTVSQLV